MNELNNTPFKDLDIPGDAKIIVSDHNIFLMKFNWKFKECEKLQLAANEIVLKNKEYRFIIFTNHPHVFTVGRGNERDQENLVDFSSSLIETLSYPVHSIHRGGGITFHYPGQWIVYPICAVSPKYSLDDHMCWLLKTTKNLLVQMYGIENLLTAKKLMGIWLNKKKVASIGVGLKRYISLHGLALNMFTDEKMFLELKKIHPCGLNPETYICIDQLTDKTLDLEEFSYAFIESIS